IQDQDALDFRQPQVTAKFQTRLSRLLQLGVDGVKADRGEGVDLEPVSPTLQNTYPLLYAKAVLAVFPPHAAAIFRAGAMGSQALVPGIWAGDQEGTWAGFEQAIRSGESAAMSGFPTWG